MESTIVQLELQVAIPLLVGLVGIGLAWLRQKLDLQSDSTASQLNAAANTAIQAAVGNFAGKVATGLTTGTITRTTALAQLRDYLTETVGDSLARFPLSDGVLTTMLLGKVAAVAGVPAPVAA